MTNLEVAFHDTVLWEIDSFIAAHPPERGGALVGPVGQPVVSRFVPDPHAAVTGVTYTPSPTLRQRVAQTERSDANLEFKGIVHSHPIGIDHPSAGDHRAFADQLGKAPWLGRMICPIVTSPGGRQRLDEHRVALGSGTLSVYVAEARVRGAVRVEPARPRVIPISRDTNLLARRLGARVESPVSYATIDGVLYAVVSLSERSADVTALFPALYPTVPPLVLLTRRAGRPGPLAEIAAGLGSSATVALPLAWSLNTDEGSRLASALDEAMARDTVRSGRHPTVPSDTSASEGSDAAREGLRARLDGAAAATLRTARVLIVGLGSGGSQTAEALARASVERFTLIDPDRVAPENLSRSVYDLADVGSAKTEALASHLRAINPAVTVDTRTAALSDVPDDELLTMIRDCDLVIAATDDPKAQRELDHRAWTLGVPAVFGGVYARGRAGEVVFTVPGITRCYRCAAANRQGRERGSAGLDYGTGQLIAEPALGADISHIVTASVKIAIGLLELGHAGAPAHSAGNLVSTALMRGYQFLILSTVPDYEFFPRLFGDAAAQHGYQSVWLSVQGDPECSTCGQNPVGAEVDLTGAPDLAALHPVDDERAGAPAPQSEDEPTAVRGTVWEPEGPAESPVARPELVDAAAVVADNPSDPVAVELSVVESAEQG
ncbi:ThiF family adenylyltransferase [Nocardia beijingensis]|uniref:ThiF family adenylyltransferase n=1 Tax=Nocardia beijingensis TaxID=95162 RepID=UPI0018959AEF|nr:ThiF family adenylyltransferase [Nocardia beijingensis]MBF6074803.1 ThiF family adenylyltransferase [Nocardia beijingensis]